MDIVCSKSAAAPAAPGHSAVFPGRIVCAALGLACLGAGLTRPAGLEAEENPPVAFVIPESAAMRGSPGGELIGTVRRGTPAVRLDQQGDWVHIAVEAWVRRTELSDSRPAAHAPSVSSQLKIAEFSLESVEKDKKGDPDKIVLKLKVQNSTDQDIGVWAGTLIVEDSRGKAIIRLPLEGGAIKQGQTAPFNFYWSESEESYVPLSAYLSNPAKLTVNLTNVSVK